MTGGAGGVWPKISLVIPSYNQGSFLEATLRSIFAQCYPALECIVVDGGSTDGSAEIVRRYAHRLTWWCSEPDDGQSHALVKGFAQASGTLMNWLNSDDLLLPEALFAIAEGYRESGADLVVGGDRHFRDDSNSTLFHFRPAGYRFPECLQFWSGKFLYHQPCTFFSRNAFLRAGGLDGGLHYTMDFDLYCRILALPNVVVRYIEEDITAFRVHGEAKTSRFKSEFLAELREVSRRYWPTTWGREQRRSMDRYSAECALFQASEALRKREWSAGAGAIGAALGYAPLHAVGFAGRRIATTRRSSGS